MPTGETPSNRQVRQFEAALRFSAESASQILCGNPSYFLPLAIKLADDEGPEDAERIVTLLQLLIVGATGAEMAKPIFWGIPHGSPRLSRLAIEAGKVLLLQVPADDELNRATRAEVLSELSERYEVIGDPSEGRRVSEESVRLFRVLAAENPAYQPKLIAALKYLSKRCSSTGEPCRAVELAAEAADRALEIADDLQGLRRFIDALDILANRQSIAGDAEGAWTTIKKADAMLGLGQAQGAELVEERAMVRLRQVTILTRLRRFKECLPIAEEAVERMQALAYGAPHSFAHLYLNAVDLAAGCRVTLGLSPSSEILQGEARAFFEVLVQEDPRRYAPRFMKYLARESAMVASSMEVERVVDLAERAAELAITVAAYHGNLHAIDEGHVFVHLAKCRLDRGQFEAAIHAIRSAESRFAAASTMNPAAAKWRQAAEEFLADVLQRHPQP